MPDRADLGFAGAGAGPRWNLWLPLVAGVMAGLLVGATAVATRALAERDRLAADGRLLQLARETEASLRDDGSDDPAAVLERLLGDARPLVVSLALLDHSGRLVARAGVETGDLEPREVQLFLGPRGRSPGQPLRGPSGRGGRLTLRATLDPEALDPPLAVRALLPAALLMGLGLLGLAILGGRLLVRQRIAAEDEARRRRLEALGQAGAGLAHQLRNPLATVKGSCQLVREEVPEGWVRTRLDAAVAESARMERLLGRLLDFARPPEPQVEPVAVLELLTEAAQRDPRLRVKAGAPGPTALVDPEHFHQVLSNLLDNALAAAPAGEPVELDASARGGEVTVVVADRGPGPGDDPESLFQPYLSRRANGTGLGLPIARAFAEANRGRLRLKARPGGGCEAVLTLPAAGPR